MKKLVVLLSIFAATALWADAVVGVKAPVLPAVEVGVVTPKVVETPAAQPAAAQPAQPTVAAPQKDEPGIMFCFARGVCNIATGVLEVPRCMIYDNGFMPVFGLIVGIPEGAFLAIARTLCGVYDIVSFGTSGSTCHGEVFPDTVFQSKWFYRK